MIKQVMASYDKKAKCYAHPFYVGHLEVGLRAFEDAANLPDHNVCKHPEDYALFHLGSFDDESGMFKLFPQPIHIAEAINLKAFYNKEGTLLDV